VTRVQVKQSDRSPGEVALDHQAAGEPRSAEALYKQLWHTLDEVIGSVATVTMLRRAARRAVPHSPLLSELATSSVDEGFGYVLPRAFLEGPATGPKHALHALMNALRPLLVEYTGMVVVQQLDLIPGLGGRDADAAAAAGAAP
jgi:hypothetical protein